MEHTRKQPVFLVYAFSSTWAGVLSYDYQGCPIFSIAYGQNVLFVKMLWTEIQKLMD